MNKIYGTYKICVNYKKVNVKNIITFLYLMMIAIIGLALFHADSTLAFGQIQSILASILLVCTFAVWTLMIIYKQIRLRWIIIVPIIYYLLYYLHSYRENEFNVMAIMRLIGFFLLDKEIQKKIFKWYRFYLVGMSMIGIICFLLYLIHFPLFYRVLPFYTSNADLYVDYGLSYLCVSGTTIQLCGLFNEPGYFGTIIGLVLCADRINLKKEGNIILLIAGIFSGSLAFFLLIIIYFILISYRKPKVMLLITLGLIVYLFILPNIEFENQTIQSFVDRFLIEDGKLAGDNRATESVDIFLKNMLHSKNAFWGMKNGFLRTISKGNLSFKTFLIDNGIFGFLLMFGSVFITALKNSKKNVYAIIFCLTFFASVYQRPDIFNLIYMSILYGGIENAKSIYIDKESTENAKNKNF